MAIKRAIDFGSLVGAQLAALIDAEAEGAERAWEFIEKVGFERGRDGKLKLRQVHFTMQRPDDEGRLRTHTISIPALTLTPLPLLAITEADLKFELNVESVTEEQGEGAQEDRRRRGLFGRRRKLSTRLSRKKSSKTTTESDLRMTVKIRQSDLPLGYERLLASADLSVRDDQE